MYGLEKRLSRIDEVESVSTDAVEGIVLIQPMSGKLIDLDELNDAITGSGFTPREIEIEVTGVIEDWNPAPGFNWKTLLVNGTERFMLAPPEIIEELEALAEENDGSVSVSGLAVAEQPADGHVGHPYTIDVKTFRAP